MTMQAPPVYGLHCRGHHPDLPGKLSEHGRESHVPPLNAGRARGPRGRC